MKELPIIFTALEVRAILDGRKTMTRRVVKLPEIISEPGDADATSVGWLDHHESGPGWHGWMTEYPEEGSVPLRCPYGQPGERLWVRETWAVPHRYDHLGPSNIPVKGVPTHYAATEERGGLRWRPSIHMCRWVSRITLEIESVRVERLQDISSDDCVAEGVGDPVGTPLLYGSVTEAWNRRSYQLRWETINGPDSWEKNPFVWVILFRRVG